MRLNERWIWAGDTLSADDAGIVVYFDFPGQWWVAQGSQMTGPFGDAEILRAVRVACTPVVDGCEKGPSKSGFWELEGRRALKPRPRQYERRTGSLPPSVTLYDERGLEPAVGCCTRFDAPPPVAWGAIDDWQAYREAEPSCGGILAASWNAHPKGSLAFVDEVSTLAGLTIVDLADIP